MRRGGAQLERPIRPDQRLVLLLRRLRHDLELGDRGGALAVRGADAVRAGVAAADHDDMLALGADRAPGRRQRFVVAGHALVLLRQEIHREMDAVQLAAGHLAGRAAIRRRRSARPRRSLRAATRPRSSTPTSTPVRNSTPSASICSHAAVDQVLFHLEVGNAVAQQAADAVGLLEQRRRMAGARQLLGAGQARRAGADDRDPLAGLACGGCGTIQPSSQPRSTIAHSIDLMVTGLSLMLSVQAASHGAGQMRPVNSGKLLVECRPRAPPATGRGRPGRSSRG